MLRRRNQPQRSVASGGNPLGMFGWRSRIGEPMDEKDRRLRFGDPAQ